ncbi:MAG: hypothetical protein JSR17_11540 [Proteobacteria bacterium]|nr:hypothetical protein [Pseudomonadota bacterium]
MLHGPNARLSFPWWYTWVKWVLPITLALASSAWLGLTLTATIPAFGMLKWAPVFFSSLEGLASLTVLTVSMGAIASMVGIATSVLARAVLSPVNEEIAKNNHDLVAVYKIRFADLENQLNELKRSSAQERDEADKAIELAGNLTKNPERARKVDTAKPQEGDKQEAAANEDVAAPRRKKTTARAR